MRILLLTQYFDPEPMLKGLPFAKELVRQGHEVEVLTGFPNYPGGEFYPGYRLRLFQREVIDGITVLRVPLYPSHDAGGFRRMANYLSFASAAAILGPWIVRRPDVIYAYHGHAPIGFPAWIIGLVRRAPFVLDIQDLWPDSIMASGMLPVRFKGLVPMVAAWCRFMYRRATKIAVLSPGFKKVLVSRGVPEGKVEVIPNWCDEIQTQPGVIRPDEAALMEGRFNVVMAGNMGKMQGLDVVLDAAQMLSIIEPAIQFVLVGGGVEQPYLQARAASLGLTNVLFLPRRPVQEIGALLHRAEALLVHLKNDPLFAITIPSRTQTYLAIGCPILCGVRGDGADLVRESGAGFYFEPEHPESLVEAVLALHRLPPEARAKLGDRGRHFYAERLSIEVGTEAFLALFATTR
ncbi:glycosyltransferase family 4 protein [Geothrix fuzhouensis]|uniref:glycosyltransferase family 4 protein n=1 Tax=Geothrix fuzhouensis TaxID=2966451 RepID=UPI002147D049|nr:glycosyltransferase family 4 protein [Geothrix fuzhouensis]